jgi:hypothetical protein
MMNLAIRVKRKITRDYNKYNKAFKESINGIDIVKRLKMYIGYRKWVRDGSILPPTHYVKQKFIRDYIIKYGIKTVVETGTYYGDMVEALRKTVDSIYSIELSKDLYNKAKIRFQKYNNIEIIHGDSGIEIKKIIPKLDNKTLFWLDGHYSKGITAKGEKITPIFEELQYILSDEKKDFIIIIDDARLFGTSDGYPSENELYDFVNKRKSNLSIYNENDAYIIM